MLSRTFLYGFSILFTLLSSPGFTQDRYSPEILITPGIQDIVPTINLWYAPVFPIVKTCKVTKEFLSDLTSKKVPVGTDITVRLPSVVEDGKDYYYTQAFSVPIGTSVRHEVYLGKIRVDSVQCP